MLSFDNFNIERLKDWKMLDNRNLENINTFTKMIKYRKLFETRIVLF